MAEDNIFYIKLTDFLKIMKENNIFIEIQDKKSYIGIL